MLVGLTSVDPVQGDAAVLADLQAHLDRFDPDFPIVTPSSTGFASLSKSGAAEAEDPALPVPTAQYHIGLAPASLSKPGAAEAGGPRRAAPLRLQPRRWLDPSHGSGTGLRRGNDGSGARTGNLGPGGGSLHGGCRR